MSALTAFVLGAVITNIQWALIYSQHLREDRNRPAVVPLPFRGEHLARVAPPGRAKASKEPEAEKT